MTKCSLSRLLAAAGSILGMVLTSAAWAQAIPQTWQKAVNGNVVTETYGYLDPQTCVVFAAPELVTTQYRTWYERWVLVPSGHYEPVAAVVASGLNIGGQTGWRLPSKSEAESYKQIQPYLHAATLNVAYWSTETRGTQVEAWRVAGNTTRHTRSGVNAYLWPVRDAENCGSR